MNNNSKRELTYVDNNELIKLVYHFFDYINVPLEWRNIFGELIENKKIVFSSTDEKDSYSCCYIGNDGVKNIRVKISNNVLDLSILIHEFIHYIVSFYKYDDLGPKNSVSEFCSIFFEKYVAKFLRDINYSYDDYIAVCNRREDNNLYIASSIKNIISDLAIYDRFRTTDEDDCKEIVDLMISTKMEDDKRNSVSSRKILIRDCDLAIDKHILKKNVIEGYQYLVSSLLADSLFEQENGDNLTKIYNLISSTEKYSFRELVEYFNLENISIRYNLDKDSNKKLVKGS